MNFIYFFIIFSIIFSSLEYFLKPFCLIDFGIIILIEYAIFEKSLNRGIIIASLIGLIQDLTIGSILGFNIFFKSVIFYFIYFLKEKFFLKNYLIKIFFCWLIFFIESILKLVIFKFFMHPIQPLEFCNYIPFLILSPFIFIIIRFFERLFIKINEI